MKKIKITALVITVSSLLLFLIGCDFGGSSSTPTTQAPAITESPSATTDNQVTTDSPSNDKEPYVSVFSTYLVPEIIKKETLEKNILIPMRKAINESVSILITEKATYRENEKPIGNYPFAREAGLIEVGKSYPYYDLICLDNPDFDMAGPVVWTDSRPNGRSALDHIDIRMFMQYYVLYNPFADGVTDKQIEDMNTAYPITKEMAVYVFDEKAKKEEIIKLETYIKTYVPSYTFEQLDKDHGEVGLGLAQIPIPDGVTSIEDETFMNYSGLKNITIPKSVTSIGDRAFAGCISLESIEIPSGVTYIGSGAFSGCANLKYNGYDNAYYLGNSGNPYMVLIKAKSTDITACNIHEDTKIIHSGAFADCTSLKTVEFPKGLINVNFYELFSGCTSLDNIEIPEIVTHIGDKAFYMCTSLKSIEIHSGVTSIGVWAFCACASLESIEIPASLSSIGDDAFAGCASLNSIDIPASVTSIGDGAFSNCASLESVRFEDNSQLDKISNYTFYSCKSLKSIEIPASVSSIEGRAFKGCYKLVEVYNRSSLSIIAGAENNGYIGYYAINIYTSASETSKLHTTDDGYAFCADADDNIYLVAYYGADTELSLPENYGGKNYVINKYAFYNCETLESINIPASVTKIGDYAFFGCNNLKSVELPDGLMSVGVGAFHECYNLQYNEDDDGFYLGNASNPYMVLIETKNADDKNDYNMRDGVKIIYSSAFISCYRLWNINIPVSVTSIGDSAFKYCNSLSAISFGGTTEQWQAIEKGIDWDKATGEYTVYCTNGYIKNGYINKQ